MNHCTPYQVMHLPKQLASTMTKCSPFIILIHHRMSERWTERKMSLVLFKGLQMADMVGQGLLLLCALSGRCLQATLLLYIKRPPVFFFLHSSVFAYGKDNLGVCLYKDYGVFFPYIFGYLHEIFLYLSKDAPNGNEPMGLNSALSTKTNSSER